jgi:hypothetical protein
MSPPRPGTAAIIRDAARINGFSSGAAPKAQVPTVDGHRVALRPDAKVVTTTELVVTVGGLPSRS